MNNMQSSSNHAFALRPVLREHVEIFPQEYRGESWYVVFDHSANKYMRFDARVYQVIGRLDGLLSLEEIFHYVNNHELVHPFTRDELLELIGQLDSAELLSGGLPIDMDASYQRHQEHKQKLHQRSLMNPLSIRIKLIDPTRLLNFLAPIGHLIFSPAGFFIWLTTLLTALLLVVAYSSQLVAEVSQISLSSWQLGIIWVVYPIIKLFHELGHGLAIKRWGGSVKEAGVNLLVFLPVPYVDATASWVFRNKWKRITVGAAGIMTELFIASVALFLWVLVEPGLFKEILLNVIVIATLSTLLFNGNPLLRFDGYFVLEDWLEIPNLASRSKQYYFYLIQRYLLNLSQKSSPITAHGERSWFLFYGLAAPIYRIFIMFAVAFYLATHFLFLGVLLASWALLNQLVVPVWKGLSYLLLDNELAQKRLRSVALATGAVFVVAALLLMPVPFVTHSQGVVAGEGDNQVVAQATGFIDEVYIKPGEKVQAGQLLMRLRDHELQQQKKELQQKRKQWLIEYNQSRNVDRVKASDLMDDLGTLDLEIKELEQDIQNAFVYSQSDGYLLLAKPGVNLKGQYVFKGQSMGQIVNKDRLVVKAYIEQSRIALIKESKVDVEIILASHLKSSFGSKIVRETPKASFDMPYTALTIEGGGKLQMVGSASTAKLKDPVFLLDLSLPKKEVTPIVGERVYVRFVHGEASLGYQLFWGLQQLFLRYLGQGNA